MRRGCPNSPISAGGRVRVRYRGVVEGASWARHYESRPGRSRKGASTRSARRVGSARTSEPPSKPGVDVEVIGVGSAEVAAPAAAENLPEGSDSGPYFGGCERGRSIPHAQISRQRRTRHMPALLGSRCSRIKGRDNRRRPVAGNDVETRPTCELGGKSAVAHPFQSNQHSCQSRVKSPSSRQLTPTRSQTIGVRLDALRTHLGAGPRG